MNFQWLWVAVFVMVSVGAFLRSRDDLREHDSRGGYGRPPVGAALIAVAAALSAVVVTWSVLAGWE